MASDLLECSHAAARRGGNLPGHGRHERSVPSMADATERWLPVVGHEGWYEVSDHGRVRRVVRGPSTKPGYILKPRPSTQGYLRYVLSRHAQKRHCTAHELVLEAFVGPRPDGHECNHKDTNKANNHLANLEWTTPKANTNHAIDRGRWAPGWRKGTREGHGRTKLTWEKAREIRRLAGSEPAWKTAARFGVSIRTVHDIRRGRAWREQPR